MSAGSGSGDSTAFDAIVLAGGRGSRLGGVDKAALELRERRLVDRAVAACRAAGAARVIVVGPPHSGAAADTVVREDPPFSGPLAALAAGLAEARAPWLMLLACDLVHPMEVAEQLSAALRTGSGGGHGGLDARGPDAASADGWILHDTEDRPQWLASCVRAEALAARLTGLHGGPADRPLRAALGSLSLGRVGAHPGSTDDIDTEEQLERARARLAEYDERREHA